MKKLLAIDLETTGLDHNKAEITVAATWNERGGQVFRDIGQLKQHINKYLNMGYNAVFHNGKFDLKFLAKKFFTIPAEAIEDTQLMAVAHTNKIPDEWLEQYELKRKELNKLLPKGHSHRLAKGYSLKTLAPYFLKVPPFWETPDNHNNDDYVLKDVEYTWRLANYFLENMTFSESVFYRQSLRPWSQMLLEAELAGITIDLELLKSEQIQTGQNAAELKKQLFKTWEKDIEAYNREEQAALEKEYTEKTLAALTKLKKPTPEKIVNTQARYQKLKEDAIKALPGFNINSPAQLKWLLKDRKGWDITKLDSEDESTGKAVLEKLAADGHEEMKLFLDYRAQEKLATAFYPSYIEMQHEGRIHTTFNLSGTRTGRLSSSEPNLQQVPGDLHKLFVARPNHVLACFDQSAIEARLLAYYSECPILRTICEKGWSIHDYNTKHIFFDLDCSEEEVKELYPKERKVSKTVGFALFYGAGWRRLQAATMTAGIQWDEYKCREVLELFKNEYSAVFEYKERVVDREFLKKQPVINLLGRPLTIPNPEDVYMKGLNTLIQSSASDLVVEGAYKAQQEFNKQRIRGQILLLVHDEIVAEIHKDDVERGVAALKKAMTNFDLSPITLEVEGKVDVKWSK